MRVNKVSKIGAHPLLEMINSKYPDYHPVMAIAELAHRNNLPPEVELNCHKAIADYITPKVKSVEIKSGDDRRRVTISMFGEETEPDIEDIEVYHSDNNDGLITVR